MIGFYRYGATCVVECNLDALDIQKMTFKKDDHTILSMYLKKSEEDDVQIFRVKVDEVDDFCQDVQIMIDDYSE